MTSRKHLKRLVRARAAKTGESYATALRHLRTRKEVPVMSDTDESPVVAICSFCKKTNKQVGKLIAGPGVYICDECVVLCNSLIEDGLSEEQSEAQRANAQPSAESILARLPRLARTAAGTEAELRRHASRAHGLGIGWDQIGIALEISPDEAQRRFGQSV